MTKSQEKLVRFRRTLLTEDEYKKAIKTDLEHKNFFVRSSCWKDVQKQAGKSITVNDQHLIDIPEDFEPDPKLVAKYRRVWNKEQKSGIKEFQEYMRLSGHRKIAEARLDSLIFFMRNNPDLNEQEKNKLLNSIEYWTKRSQQK